MSAWSDLGLPTPNSGDYTYTISPGIYRTPFPTYKPDQATQYQKSRKTFSLSIDLDRTQLKTAEDYLRSVGYRQFGMELVTAEGRLVETAIRLTEPYRVTPKGFRTFVLSLTAETVSAFWTGQTYYVEDAELSTVYTSPEWSLSDQIPASSTLEVRSGQVRYQPPGSSSWTQWVSTNLIIEGGGKIQVRQTSSDEYEEETAGDVRIGGVAWRIVITTKSAVLLWPCEKAPTQDYWRIYGCSFSESGSGMGTLLNAYWDDEEQALAIYCGAGESGWLELSDGQILYRDEFSAVGTEVTQPIIDQMLSKMDEIRALTEAYYECQWNNRLNIPGKTMEDYAACTDLHFSGINQKAKELYDLDTQLFEITGVRSTAKLKFKLTGITNLQFDFAILGVAGVYGGYLGSPGAGGKPYFGLEIYSNENEWVDVYLPLGREIWFYVNSSGVEPTILYLKDVVGPSPHYDCQFQTGASVVEIGDDYCYS